MGWQNLSILDFDVLADARLQAHYAVQWLARAARTYIEPKADDSHTSLFWSRELDSLTTQPIASGARLGLALGDMILFVLAPDGSKRSMGLDGISDEEVGNWVESEMEDFGFDPTALNDPLPYELPHHAITEGQAYDVIATKSALRELSRWYANADIVLSELRRDYMYLSPGPSPVRCWPHHFDIAVLIGLEEGDFESARSVGVGLSPGDDNYNEPYFYVSPWPHLKPDNLPSFSTIGNWHTEGFVGAVATASEFINEDDQAGQAISFLRQAVDFGIDRLKSAA